MFLAIVIISIIIVVDIITITVLLPITNIIQYQYNDQTHQ